jgi:hypothetical protein
LVEFISFCYQSLGSKASLTIFYYYYYYSYFLFPHLIQVLDLFDEFW